MCPHHVREAAFGVGRYHTPRSVSDLPQEGLEASLAVLRNLICHTHYLKPKVTACLLELQQMETNDVESRSG